MEQETLNSENGHMELVLSLNRAASALSKEIDKIISKNPGKLLSDDNKMFEKLIVLFEKADKIKALGRPLKETKSKTDIAVTKEAEAESQSPNDDISNNGLNINPGGNIYEHVLSEVRNGKSKN